MFDPKPADPPLSFEQVAAAERKSLRPDEGTAKPLSALCISGGGIRSATFALGAIQGLAEKAPGILGDLDYLSTVSGGGYIGSWLTAWKQREGGLDKIIPALQPAAPFPPTKDPDPLQHLREYNNYLSPKLGLFSADTWTLAATVVRNMILNWLVLVPLLMFVLMAPRLLLSLARMGEHLDSLYGYGWNIKLEPVIATLAGLAFAIATFNALRYLPGVGKTNHTETDFVRYCLAPLIGAALSFFTLESWITGGTANSPTTLKHSDLLLGITAALVAGWLAYLVVYFKKTYKRVGLMVVLVGALLLTGVGTASLVWVLVSRIFPYMRWASYVAFAPPLLLMTFALPVILFVGLTSNVLEDEDREWLSRAGAWFLLFILGWAGVCGLVLVGPVLAFHLPVWGRSAFAAAGGAGGVLTAIGGFGLKSVTKKSTSDPNQPESKSGTAALAGMLLRITAAIFVVIFLAGLAILTNWLLSLARLVPGDWTVHRKFVADTPTNSVLIAAAVFMVLAWVMARFIDINKFSLHGMYRNRLIRAYLGASNRPEQVNRFIGFAQDDDTPMHTLRPELKPFPVVNVTLNLVSGDRLAWQQRKAEAFTVTPLYCGSSQLGYRPSEQYAGGISLGTAMALSGAAASPNMGYYSSPVIGFIMTLFNARLGAWLGNPGKRGDGTWHQQGPKSAVASIVREIFGLTNADCPYVYLSDGGHFENLGIYEMVKRHCHYIFVLDGASDGQLKFNDLGNALRKVRIDTKIDIQFDDGWERDLRDGNRRWVVARICYRDAGLGEDGFLVYIKPMLRGTEPPDVVAYHAANPDFPNQSTANQFFNEAQTESYRMLGLCTMREMFASWDSAKGFPGLVEHLRATQAKAAPEG